MVDNSLSFIGVVEINWTDFVYVVVIGIKRILETVLFFCFFKFEILEKWKAVVNFKNIVLFF